MTEDDDEDELGQVGDQVNGIADRFGGKSETTETSETIGTTETTDSDPSQSAETTETPDTTSTSETIETGETTETPSPGDEEFVLREHWNGRTIYLPDDVVDDLDLAYKRCSVKWQEQRGGELPKNERFYPAVVRAALNQTSVEAELGLND
jgi:hypothetical protein